MESKGKLCFLLVRHGRTEGNLLKRYIGTTDEPLVPEEEDRLRLLAGKTGSPDHVFSSPMLRCRQTAKLLTGTKGRIIPDLRECDFGQFENKNYLELSGSEEYQRWIDSGGTLPFPGGESVEGFRDRCVSAFEEVLRICREEDAKNVLLAVHGGTVMSIMAAFGKPERSYYDWHVDNACGYQAVWDDASRSLTEIRPFPKESE